MHRIFWATAILTIIPRVAFTSGFEKSIPFGGKSSGVAGIGAPDIQGSQALFFNPANLATDKESQDVSLNISPTFVQFKAPTIADNNKQESSNITIFPYALMYQRSLNEKLGVGIGTYISGGTEAKFSNVAVTSGSLEAKTDLIITEYALGAGYKVTEDLKLGLAWRVTTVAGGLNNISMVTGIPFPVESDLRNLKDTNYTGFKFGAEYHVDEKTNVAFTYRSEVDFKAKGVLNSHSAFSGGQDVDATVGTLLPAAWSLSGTCSYVDHWKFLAEYVFIEYSKVTNLAVDSGGVSSPVQLQWNDEHNIRLGAEYAGLQWPIRFGYIWTSQVTNTDHPISTLIPPAPANTVTLGTGQTFDNISVDGGFEYTMLSGTASQAAKYEVTLYAFHLGASYNF